MKAIVTGVLMTLLLGGLAVAQDHYVNGYYRSNGTYVSPHYQTNPNSTTSDNYSTRGNYNPYTGEPGTKPDTRPSYGNPSASPYGSSYDTPSSPGFGDSRSRASSYGSSYPPAASSNCTSIYGC